MKKYILLGIVGLVFLSGCGKDESVLPSSRKENSWIEIKDEPGELNQLRYQLYKKYGISLFVSDTVGGEERGLDAYGKPIVYYELLRPGYNITSAVNCTVVSSSDISSLIDAARLMLDYVAPRLSKNEKYRPYSYYLCDSIYYRSESLWHGKYMVPSYLNRSSKTTSIEISGFATLNGNEKKMWAGRILGNAVASKVVALFTKELKDFYNITNEGFTSSQYGRGYVMYRGTQKFPDSRMKTLYGIGFLDNCSVNVYYIDNKIEGSYPSTLEDAEAYMGAVYVFTEAEFQEMYGSYDKMIRKFKKMKEIVDQFKTGILQES